MQKNYQAFMCSALFAIAAGQAGTHAAVAVILYVTSLIFLIIGLFLNAEYFEGDVVVKDNNEHCPRCNEIVTLGDKAKKSCRSCGYKVI